MATAVDVAAVRRRVAKVRLVEGSSLELDSHADLAVLGADCHVLARTGKMYEVYGYDESLGSNSREVVSGLFAYDDPMDGSVSIIVVHQGLHVPTMQGSLIPPAQMRMNNHRYTRIETLGTFC